jgi:cytochrome b561
MYLHAVEALTAISTGLTILLVVVVRYAWRRGKSLEEP